MALILIISCIVFVLLSIISLHKKSLDWYSEESMLKVTRTYEATFFSVEDFLFSALIPSAFFIFIAAFKLYSNQFITVISLIFISLICLLPPIFHFKIKFQLWEQNKGKSYTFDPILSKITILGNDKVEFNLNDIEKIEQYIPINKLAQGYIKLFIKNHQNQVILTPLLPCYPILMDFFAGLEKEIIYKKNFKIS